MRGVARLVDAARGAAAERVVELGVDVVLRGPAVTARLRGGGVGVPRAQRGQREAPRAR